MRRTASDERCGSGDGIVAEGFMSVGIGGLTRRFPLIQSPIAPNHRMF
jgi:hypothetical protein